MTNDTTTMIDARALVESLRTRANSARIWDDDALKEALETVADAIVDAVPVLREERDAERRREIDEYNAQLAAEKAKGKKE